MTGAVIFVGRRCEMLFWEIKGWGRVEGDRRNKKAPGMLAWRRKRFQKRKARRQGRCNAALAGATPQLAQDQHLSIDARNVDVEKQNSLASTLDVFSLKGTDSFFVAHLAPKHSERRINIRLYAATCRVRLERLSLNLRPTS